MFLVMSTEVEMMKERFAKLLVGEDMSGGGKGVCTALAVSNAITNLAGKLLTLNFQFFKGKIVRNNLEISFCFSKSGLKLKI